VDVQSIATIKVNEVGVNDYGVMNELRMKKANANCEVYQLSFLELVFAFVPFCFNRFNSCEEGNSTSQ
jgi:hypothetical protein